MKALQHQNCLMELNLSNNFIGNDGVKSLSQMLSTLKELDVLDISGNMIDDQGLEQLSNSLEKNLTLTEIKQLKLSFNPIQSSSLTSISALCRSKRIAAVFLAGCDFVESDNFGVLESIKFIDLSYNHLSTKGFKVIVSKLSSNIIETLNLERCSVECNLGNSLVQILTSKTFTALKEINLAGLKFNENEILDILRGLEKCDQLRKLNLSHQKDLTFLSLKYILINMDSRNLQQVKLIGCRRLQCIDNMFNINSIDSHCPKSLQNVEISLPNAKTSFDERETFIEKMKELWEVISGDQGKVEQDGNILRLTQGDKSIKENNFY